MPGIVVTGNRGKWSSFEVIDVDSGKSYWSKFEGDGFLDNNPSAMENVAARIHADANGDKQFGGK